MSSAARIPGADLRTPTWTARPGASDAAAEPQRDVPADTPGVGRPRVSIEQHPGLQPLGSAGVVPGASAAGVPGDDASVSQAAAPSVPPEEQALDPRTIARASLAAGRNSSLWWTLGGIGAAVGAAFVRDAVAGVLVLAALLVVYGVVRAVGAPPGPAAVAVRSKTLDVTILLGCAVALVTLAAILPTA